MEKRALCILSSSKNKYLTNPTSIEGLYYAYISPTAMFHLPRSLCETNEDYLQLIPCCVFTRNNHKEVLTYVRQGTEERLHDLHSCIIGGHINADLSNVPVVTIGIAAELVREIEEELEIKLNREMVVKINRVFSFGVGLYGIYTDADAVSRVHLGLLTIINLDNMIYYPLLKQLENIEQKHLDEIGKPKWMSIEDISKKPMEKWTNIVVDYLFTF